MMSCNKEVAIDNGFNPPSVFGFPSDYKDKVNVDTTINDIRYWGYYETVINSDSITLKLNVIATMPDGSMFNNYGTYELRTSNSGSNVEPATGNIGFEDENGGAVAPSSRFHVTVVDENGDEADFDPFLPSMQALVDYIIGSENLNLTEGSKKYIMGRILEIVNMDSIISAYEANKQ